MRKLAVFSTVAAVVFAVMYCRSVSLPSGGGQFKPSPDGAFVADASSLRNDNPLAAGSRTYYEFTVRRVGGPVLKRTMFYPAENNDSGYFRTLPQIIVWSPDSTTVTFTVPGVTLQFDVAKHPD